MSAGESERHDQHGGDQHGPGLWLVPCQRLPLDDIGQVGVLADPPGDPRQVESIGSGQQGREQSDGCLPESKCELAVAAPGIQAACSGDAIDGSAEQVCGQQQPADDERAVQVGPGRQYDRDQDHSPPGRPGVVEQGEQQCEAGEPGQLRSDDLDLLPADGQEDGGSGDRRRDPVAAAGDQDGADCQQCTSADQCGVQQLQRFDSSGGQHTVSDQLAQAGGVDQWRVVGVGQKWFSQGCQSVVFGHPASVGEVSPEVGVPQRLPGQHAPQSCHCRQEQQGTDELSGAGQSGVHLRFRYRARIDYNLDARQ